MAAVVDQPGPGSPPPHDTGTGRARWTRLQKRAIKVLVYVVFAYLLFRLLPALKQALRSLEHVRWPWILGAVAPELLSEFGYVQSWRGIVDPDRVLAADGGARTATRAVWAQLAGGLVMPGGSLTSIGIGAWILRRFGMPATTIAERQCNLSFLNTAASIGSVSAAVRATDRILFHRQPAEPRRGARIPGVRCAGAVDCVPGDLRPPAAGLCGRRDGLHHRGTGRLDPTLPAGIGAVGGITGMLVLYGVGRDPAIGAVLLYEAVGLLVPGGRRRARLPLAHGRVGSPAW